MASNLEAMASNQRAMASTLTAIAFNLIANYVSQHRFQALDPYKMMFGFIDLWVRQDRDEFLSSTKAQISCQLGPRLRAKTKQSAEQTVQTRNDPVQTDGWMRETHALTSQAR